MLVKASTQNAAKGGRRIGIAIILFGVAMRPVILLSAICLLVACSATWYKPGASQQDFNVDRQECLAQAYREAPTATVAVPITPGSNQPIYTNCAGGYNSMSCTTTGGGYTPPAHIYVDQNSSARDAIFKDCLTSMVGPLRSQRGITMTTTIQINQLAASLSIGRGEYI